MGKKLAVGILIIIIAVVGIYIQYGYPQEPITESQAKNIIKDKYPEIGDDDITTSYEDNCTVCDESGCRMLEDCWTANFTIGGTNYGVIIDGKSGKIVEESESPCTEWWCDAEDCVYFYKEIIPNGSKSYYNTGCINPEPTCDQQYEKCRECQASGDCTRKIITKTNETIYYYEIIDANAWGSINDTSFYCRIVDEGDEIFYNQTTVEECESIMVAWSRCYGWCDFEPSFGLIPY
ncbi:MAG: hypothetical protein JSW41_00595 [Candidatus Aenigmatarchaeota archaeon]|nr:MAG: hypothetical protein JSW41_00595 [Candidatus Aenigmarchaeota archaeon]